MSGPESVLSQELTNVLLPCRWRGGEILPPVVQHGVRVSSSSLGYQSGGGYHANFLSSVDKIVIQSLLEDRVHPPDTGSSS